jgi:hypothetical protein
MFIAESVFRKQKFFRLLMLSKLDETTYNRLEFEAVEDELTGAFFHS